MDPNQTIWELIDAIEAEDHERIHALAEALGNWLHRGGFLPDVSDVQLAAILQSWCDSLVFQSVITLMVKHQDD